MFQWKRVVIGIVGWDVGSEAGCYPYIKYLSEIDSCQPARPLTVPDKLWVIATPFQLINWRMELRHHTDQQIAQFLVRGLDGTRIPDQVWC